MSEIALSFYDHHRQNYGAMPIREVRACAEFMVGDYGTPDAGNGVGEGGEFAIYLTRLQYGPLDGNYLSPSLRVYYDATGSLRAFLGAWESICRVAERKGINSRDDLTALLLGAGLRDRSDHPVGWQAVCSCCGQATAAQR